MNDDDAWLKALVWPLSLTVGFSSIAGIAAMRRYKQEVHARHWIAAISSSIVAGVVVLLLLESHLHDNQGLWIGTSILAGAGGGSTIDLLLTWFRSKAESKGLLEKKDGS